MPRRPRIKLADIPQHVVQRGINREPCFFAEEDYHCYLHWLQKSAADWHCDIHAYVLMTNHVHLLATSEKPEGIAKMMQSIGRRYVQYINCSYHRTGSLWEGRFKSSLVQVEEYLLTCMRYIELNPVRTNMVNDPAQYRWSSYRQNGLGQAEFEVGHRLLRNRQNTPTTTITQSFPDRNDMLRFQLAELGIRRVSAGAYLIEFNSWRSTTSNLWYAFVLV